MPWTNDYRKKRLKAQAAMRIIKSGDRVFTSGNAATPRLLFRALIERKHELHNVELWFFESCREDPNILW